MAASLGSLLLFYLLFTQQKKSYFYFALLFLLAHFSTLEWALWIQGKNFFEMLLTTTPLTIYLAVWLVFVMWVSERVVKDRRLTVLIAAFTLLSLWLAPRCMNWPTECQIF
jgi:glucose dehydrogenase